jgi:hypothetical protein
MMQTATKKILVVTRRWPEEVELRIARDYDARINLAGRLYSSDQLISDRPDFSALCSPPGVVAASNHVELVSMTHPA